MKATSWLSATLLLGAILLPGPGVSAEVLLVRDGESLAPIVVFEDAPPFTRQAADELAEYIEKTTGARPEVIEGRPDPLPESAIWVGYQPVLDELFPELDFDFQHPEEILIAANESHLVVAGRDRWDPENMTMHSRRRTVSGVQQEYGTANAVYTFLQDHLGVRWLWPGELGEDILKRDTLSFVPFESRYHPQIRRRQTVFWWSSLIPSPHSQSHDWTRLQRLQLDSLDAGHRGHAYTDWWERFHETHPEYFALQPDGARSGWPDARRVKICHSNPKVAQQWLADVEDYLADNPNHRVFSAADNDGQYAGHCICENCLAWDHPEGEPRRFVWEGVIQEHVALSDRLTHYANRCARLLKERYPDKDYYVYQLAYGFSRPAPVEAELDDNVIIGAVANFLNQRGATDRISPAGATHREQFDNWAKVAPAIIWRPNTGSPAGWHQAQPDVSIAEAIEDFRWVAERGAVGIHIDIVWEHWATQGPMYYAMAHMAWDPYQDGQALMADYYRRGFGAAAGEVEAYWGLMEHTRNRYVNEDMEFWEAYDEAFFERAYGLLARADEAVADAPGVYRRRIAFFRTGLDYTRLIIDTRQAMARLRETDGADDEARERALANWEAMERIGRDKEFDCAINWCPSLTQRMRSLHPDSL